ncbi:hypothetical protein Aduo_009217 [Ancylostoma duodenale]
MLVALAACNPDEQLSDVAARIQLDLSRPRYIIMFIQNRSLQSIRSALCGNPRRAGRAVRSEEEAVSRADRGRRLNALIGGGGSMSVFTL